MASKRGLASFGRRFVGQICTRDSVIAPALSLRRGVHVSVYDKNIEEERHSQAVPDDVISPQPTDKYWAPHPQTGVFVPAADQKLAGTSQESGGSKSALEQTTFFRSAENLDKPVVQP